MATNMERIANQILAIRQKVNTINKSHRYSLDDVRGTTFNNFEGMIAHFYIIHTMFSAFEKGLVNPAMSQALFGFNARDPEAPNVLYNMTKYEKLLFAVVVNFNVEVFAKIILQKLQSKNPPKGFYNIIDELLKELNLSDRQNKFQTLYTMARIRNALHSNGVHTDPDIAPYMISGHTFEFRNGNEVRCADWPQLCMLLGKIIDILDEVVESPRVKGITQILPWQYYPI